MNTTSPRTGYGSLGLAQIHFFSVPKKGAREFSERELPVGKRVVVRFDPKNPGFNDLELDSWTYTGDRPTSLSI
jgi:hypothetical protein